MKFGLEVLKRFPGIADDWGACALMCNQASVTQEFETSWDILYGVLGGRLKAFFGPQHGFHATVQDNMIETSHSMKGPYNLPIFSLYSEVREPPDKMLDGIDSIIIDIQIVGCRVYTFKYTIAGCLRAAKRLGKRVIVLDRPNPLGGSLVDGRILDLKAKSFVGEFEIPLRHGLTAAEAALFFNRSIGACLEIVKMESWHPDSYWHENFRHWILTSPNLPTVDSVYVYPATVLLEGTNISEGRGTGLPFQFVGAPYIQDAEEFVKRVRHYHRDEGFHLRPTEFQPTSQKWQGKICKGFQIHVLDQRKLESFKLGLSIIRASMDVAPNEFCWMQPPYEYDFHNLPINLILGDLGASKRIENQFNPRDRSWDEGLDTFILKVKDLLLYPRDMYSFA